MCTHCNKHIDQFMGVILPNIFFNLHNGSRILHTFDVKSCNNNCVIPFIVVPELYS